jgi:hypothetical protein
MWLQIEIRGVAAAFEVVEGFGYGGIGGHGY